MNLNFNFNGRTRLKHWWTIVRDNFQTVMNSFNSHISDFETEKTKLNTEITQRTNADIALSDRINTEASTRSSADTALGQRITSEVNARTTADNTLAQDISEETEARKSSDNEIKASIAQMRADYFGDGSTMTFEWTGDLPEPQLQPGGSEPYADFNLSGMFKLDGVPCGTMESTGVLLNALGNVDEATTYIVACFNADTGEITVKDSNNYVETSVTNNICSLTVAEYYIEVTPNSNGVYWFVACESWPYTGSAIVAKAGLSDRIERNSQAIATMQTELNDKVEKIDGMGLSANDYTNAEKTKLAGIAVGANKTVVDTSLSSTSTNPVQNKVIKAALDNLTLSDNNGGIVSVEQTTTSNADGGTNIITVTMTDGTVSTFTVKNGSKGSTGAKGATGAAGADGVEAATIVVKTTSELTSAISSLPSNGGKIILREGTYTISSALTCNKNVIFEGMGNASKVSFTDNFLKISSGCNVTVRDICFNGTTDYYGAFDMSRASNAQLYLDNCNFTLTSVDTGLVDGRSSSTNTDGSKVYLNRVTVDIVFSADNNVLCGAVIRDCKIRGGEGCHFVIDHTNASYRVNVFYCCDGMFSNGIILGTQYVIGADGESRSMSIANSYITCEGVTQIASTGGDFINNKVTLKNGYVSFKAICGNEIYKTGSGSLFLYGRVVSGNVILNHAANDTIFSTYSSVTGNVSKYTLNSSTPTGTTITGNVVDSSLKLCMTEG